MLETMTTGPRVNLLKKLCQDEELCAEVGDGMKG
jgi:hypothetical protein